MVIVVLALCAAMFLCAVGVIAWAVHGVLNEIVN